MQTKTLILGLGNLLLGDDGLGVRALELLQARYLLPDHLVCVDGGVLGMGLLAHLEGVGRLLVIDAVRTGREPGTLLRLQDDEIPKTLSLNLSLHQLGFADVLAISLLRGTLPPQLVVWGMEPAVMEAGVGLSPAVTDRLGHLVDEIADELRSWDIPMLPAAIPG